MELTLKGVRYDWWGVLFLIVTIYLVINLVLLHGGGYFTVYVLIPILWSILALTVWQLGAQRPAGRARLRSTIAIIAAGIGLVQIFAMVFGGILYSFGNSPYSFTPKSIVQNFFYVTTALIGMELSRAWLLNHRHISRLNLYVKLMPIALLFTFISIPLSTITGVRADLESLQWINSTFFPSLAENLLATYLALMGGALPALLYRGLLQYFTWFCPILPDMEWVIKGLIGTGIPVAGLIVVEALRPNHQRAKIKKKIRARSRRKRYNVIGWAITAALVLGMVLFSTGTFGFKPTVLVSGSMQPALEVGDIALIKKVDPLTIREGDIIKFKEDDGASVIHRVIAISEEEGQRTFQTKGDANSDPDRETVYEYQIEGRVIYTIPKIGWVSIGIKELLAR